MLVLTRPRLTPHQHWLAFQSRDRVLQLLGKLLQELPIHHWLHVAAQVVDEEPVTQVTLLCNEIKVVAACPASTSLRTKHWISLTALLGMTWCCVHSFLVTCSWLKFEQIYL